MSYSSIAVSAVLVAFLLTGCRAERAILHDPGPDGSPAEYAVQIPDGYEVRSIGFGTTYSSSVSGGGSVGNLTFPVTGSSSQHPYVHVYALEVASGQEVLLVYGDIRRRVEPVAIIRLQKGSRTDTTG